MFYTLLYQTETPRVYFFGGLKLVWAWPASQNKIGSLGKSPLLIRNAANILQQSEEKQLQECGSIGQVRELAQKQGLKEIKLHLLKFF